VSVLPPNPKFSHSRSYLMLAGIMADEIASFQLYSLRSATPELGPSVNTLPPHQACSQFLV